MKLTLQPLPYAENALEPIISSETVHLHYHMHQAGYVKKTNELLGGSAERYASLEALIEDAAARRQDLFSQAGQAWNHEFFWRSLHAATDSQAPAVPAVVAALIKRDFGSTDGLIQDLLARAEAHFGSGWLWLVLDDNALTTATTPNARPAFVDGLYPLLTVDLWEHAYYVDYRNRRQEFVEKCCTKLLNWDFAATRIREHGRDVGRVQARA
jgi:superoxide dismutase, Fe-Mn family